MVEKHTEGIDKLKAMVGQPIQSNRFVIKFLKLPAVFGNVGQDNLSILCKSVDLPGKEVGTTEHIRHRYMPDGTVDYGQSISLSYICDSNFMDRMIIEEWLRYVHSADVETRTGLEMSDDSKVEGQVFSFYDDYARDCSAEVYVLRRDGSVAMTYHFHEVFPQSIDSMSMDMDTDGVLEFSFDLAYRHWTTKYHPMDQEVNMNQPMEGNFEISGLNKGRKIFDAVLEGLKVAGRFNKKAGAMGRRLGQLDTAITRGSNISRDIGGSFNSNYVTEKRRGGG